MLPAPVCVGAGGWVEFPRILISQHHTFILLTQAHNHTDMRQMKKQKCAPGKPNGADKSLLGGFSTCMFTRSYGKWLYRDHHRVIMLPCTVRTHAMLAVGFLHRLWEDILCYRDEVCNPFSVLSTLMPSFLEICCIDKNKSLIFKFFTSEAIAYKKQISSYLYIINK